MSLRKEEWQQVRDELELSPRETQVAQLIVDDDLTDHAIGRKLGLRPGTVRTYIQRLFQKLDVHSRCALNTRIRDVIISHLRH